jgi:hypothetical protein
LINQEKRVEPTSPRFVDEQERELFAIAKLGEEVRAFLQGHPVGQLLHNRAKQMILQAEADALEVDPDTDGAMNKLRQIRQQAAVGRAFINWLGQAIVEGDAAGRDLEDYRNG